MNRAMREKQKRYYAETASQYDGMHVADNDAHMEALTLIAGFARMMGAKRILDVGAGRGRAVLYLSREGFDAVGIEPVAELIEEARVKGVGEEQIRQASGDRLPFENESFDFVIETGVLHHVENPADVVREMCRCARSGVFLSDSNRYGQGRALKRWVQFAIKKLGLWEIAYFIKTKGNGYDWSEGDGLFYSYSVYDNLRDLSCWANRIYFLPVGENNSRAWLSPLFTHGHVLLCALKGRPRAVNSARGSAA